MAIRTRFFHSIRAGPRNGALNSRGPWRLPRWRRNDVATSVPAVPIHPSSVASVTGTVATYRSERVAE